MAPVSLVTTAPTVARVNMVIHPGLHTPMDIVVVVEAKVVAVMMDGVLVGRGERRLPTGRRHVGR